MLSREWVGLNSVSGGLGARNNHRTLLFTFYGLIFRSDVLPSTIILDLPPELFLILQDGFDLLQPSCTFVIGSVGFVDFCDQILRGIGAILLIQV